MTWDKDSLENLLECLSTLHDTLLDIQQNLPPEENRQFSEKLQQRIEELTKKYQKYNKILHLQEEQSNAARFREKFANGLNYCICSRRKLKDLMERGEYRDSVSRSIEKTADMASALAKEHSIALGITVASDTWVKIRDHYKLAGLTQWLSFIPEKEEHTFVTRLADSLRLRLSNILNKLPQHSVPSEDGVTVLATFYIDKVEMLCASQEHIFPLLHTIALKFSELPQNLISLLRQKSEQQPIQHHLKGEKLWILLIKRNAKSCLGDEYTFRLDHSSVGEARELHDEAKVRIFGELYFAPEASCPVERYEVLEGNHLDFQTNDKLDKFNMYPKPIPSTTSASAGATALSTIRSFLGEAVRW